MPKTKGTILVVDDEASVLELTAELLRRMGFNVIEASSGPDALEKSAMSENMIDLLLTDLIMPGMTGRVLADTLTARMPGLEVIFMSGYINDLRFSLDPELHYIQKPFDPLKLSKMISHLLRKKRKTA